MQRKWIVGWRLWVVLCILIGWSSVVAAQIVEIPDPNLRAAVREKLGLAQGVPLTRADMEGLTDFGAANREVVDLTGLEHAVNLRALTLWGNPISDLSSLAPLTQLEYLDLKGCEASDVVPLASLTRLEVLSLEWNWLVADISSLASLTRMRELKLSHNLIVDISPLGPLTELEVLWLDDNRISDINAVANLTHLVSLRLYHNQIVDISPLFNLTELVELRLNRNQIVDISPLAGLHRLEHLEIEENYIVDYSPLDRLNLIHLSIDTLCLSPQRPIEARLDNRSFPSVFAAWGGFGWSPVSNLTHLSDAEHIALHDLWWAPSFDLRWRFTADGVKLMGNGVVAKDKWDAVVSLNPNIIILRGITMRAAYVDDFYRQDFPYWLRDNSGQRVRRFDLDAEAYLLDFTRSGMQDVIVEQVIAVAECGLYDGVFFDYWQERSTILTNSTVDPPIVYRGNEAEQQARDNILQRVRDAVGSDFLIIGNANRRKLPRTGTYINGTFMETGRDHDKGYNLDGLMRIEDTLLWSEENLREPRVNCLEGWKDITQPIESPTNLRWMRLFTTMGLTHSDGYVLFRTHNQDSHDHHWYDFYDTDLGRPVGEKAQQYENTNGLFIREFSNGWAVYNRSGAEQTITLPQSAEAVSSGLTNTTHLLADLDGEIYLAIDEAIDTEASRLTFALTSSTPIAVGDRITLTLNAESVSDLAGWQLGIRFNPNVLKAIEVIEGDLLKKDGGLTFFQRGNIHNTVGSITGIRAALLGGGGVTGDGSLMSLVFEAKAVGGGGVQLNNVQLGSAEEEPIAVAEIGVVPVVVGDGGVVWDVDTNGRVDILDLILVSQNLGASNPTNPRSDINGDGAVDILDMILVAQHFGETASSLAPSLMVNHPSLDSRTVQGWIDMAVAVDDGSIGFQQGLANLKSLLLMLAPVETVLLPNYPNPFNPETWLPYQLSSDADVQLWIYDIEGIVVRQLVLGHQPPGFYTDRSKAAYWDGRSNTGERVASGVYFYRLDAGSYSATRKMIILK